MAGQGVAPAGAGPSRVRVGQVWRRLADGAEVHIVEVDPPDSGGRRSVSHRGARLAHTEWGPFLRKYELVREEPVVEEIATVVAGVSTQSPREIAAAVVDALGLGEVFTVAWDGEPSMSGRPHVMRTGSEVPSRESAEHLASAWLGLPTAPQRTGVRVQRRVVGPWADEVGA